MGWPGRYGEATTASPDALQSPAAPPRWCGLVDRGPPGQGGRGPVGGRPTPPRVFQLPHFRPVLPHQPGTSPSTPPLEIHLAWNSARSVLD